MVRADREGREGGGVACYVRESLRARVLASSPPAFANAPEYLILEVRDGTREPLLFTSMYRRPKGRNFDEYVDALTGVLHNYKNIVITGDLNCNLLTSSYESNHLRDVATQLSLHIVESNSTFHTASSDSWLDVFLVDNLDKVLSFSKSNAPFINGHDLIELTYALGVSSFKSRSLTRRCYRDFEEHSFLETLIARLSASFAQDFSQSSPSESELDNFLNTITNDFTASLDKHAPIHTFRVSRPPAPWLSVALTDRIRHRNRLYNIARRSGSILDFQVYRNYRNNLTLDLRKARERYHMVRLSSVSDPSKMWRELSNLGLIQSSLPSPLSFFSRDVLNSYYASISNRLPSCSQTEFSDILLSVTPEEPRSRSFFLFLRLGL
ncbi:uncharacterized protein LOC143901904 [Temnothorax americanus]|uniref:uncharacterized protein LOC143901904 n=1 Tax=Temnothorax americanus TaxID=1964332 RepID=UPI004068D1E0